MNRHGNKKGLAACEAIEQTLQRGHDGLFIEAVVHLAALLAHTHQASPAQQVEVVRDGRAAERHALGNLADIQFRAGKKLHQILAHWIGQRGEQVTTDSQVLAKRLDFWVEGTGIDQTAQVLLVHQWNTLKHINILQWIEHQSRAFR